MDTPSLVIVGAPHFFSSTTLRPLGPRVTLTASASVFMPRSRPRRASSSKAISLGIAPAIPHACCVGVGHETPATADPAARRSLPVVATGLDLAATGTSGCHSHDESANQCLALAHGECKKH